MVKKDTKKLQLQKNIIACSQKKCDIYFKKIDSYLKNFKECKSIKKMNPKCINKIKNEGTYIKLMAELGNCATTNCKKERDLLDNYVMHKFDLLLQKGFQLELLILNLIIKIKQKSHKKVSKQQLFKTVKKKEHTPGQIKTIKNDIDRYYDLDIKTLKTKSKELKKSQSKITRNVKKTLKKRKSKSK